MKHCCGSPNVCFHLLGYYWCCDQFFSCCKSIHGMRAYIISYPRTCLARPLCHAPISLGTLCCTPDTAGLSVFAASKMTKPLIENSGPPIPAAPCKDNRFTNGDWVVFVKCGIRCETCVNRYSAKTCATHPQRCIASYFLGSK